MIDKLTSAFGVSGFEGDVRDIMQKEFKKYATSVKVDDFGNLIATKKGKANKPTVMIAAHMDEIGLMVKSITKDGFLKFEKVGGIDDRLLVNRRVELKTRKGFISGVIGFVPPHLVKEKERKKVFEYDRLAIDIGASDEASARKLVEIGDPARFVGEYTKLAGSNIMANAIDDRIGCWVLIEVAKALKTDYTVHLVGTVQEEVGLKGARMVAYRLNPDFAYAVDTTLATDSPLDKAKVIKVGSGPSITLAESGGRGLITHPKIKERLIQTAKKNNIPYQLDVGSAGMTDAAIIYLTREGIPSGTISIASRYIHSPAGVCSMDDARNCAKLIVNSLK